MASISSSVSRAVDRMRYAKSKIKALYELFDKLTRDHIRFLQTKNRAVKLRCDPIGKLPLELCYLIFQYLEVYQIYQVQRVSRSWYRFLSSRTIVETLALRPWFGNSETRSRIAQDSAQRNLGFVRNSPPDVETSLQARHIDSFRNGTAFSMATGSWQTSVTDKCVVYYIAFAGTILAWACPQTGCIQLRFLVSGHGFSLFTLAQEEISQIAISATTVIAMTVLGKCFAWGLSSGLQGLMGQSPSCIEIHAETHQWVSVSGSAVAILGIDEHSVTHITTWETTSHQTHRFVMHCNTDTTREIRPRQMIILPGAKSVVFFKRFLGESRYVWFQRTNLKGQIESSGRMEHPDIEDYSRHSEHLFPVYTDNCVTIWSYVRRKGVLDIHQTKVNSWEIMRVVYDTKTDQLEVRRHTVQHSIQTKLRATDFFWWKDVAYFGNYENELGKLEILDLNTSVCKNAHMCTSTLVPEDEETFGNWHNGDSWLMGNETFLLYVRSGHYTVWCFEDVRLAGEHQGYRFLMMEKKKQDLEAKKKRSLRWINFVRVTG